MKRETKKKNKIKIQINLKKEYQRRKTEYIG